MAEGISKSDLEDVFAKFFGGGGGGGAKTLSMDPKSLEEFKKSIKESTKALKEQNSAGKAYEAMFRGHRQAMQDATKEFEDLDKQIEELAKTAKTSNDREAVYQLQKERDAKQNVIQSQNTRAAFMNLGVSAGEVATSMIKSAFQYAKDLQSGASGVEAGTAVAERAARTTGDAVSNVGKSFQEFGPILGMLFKKLPYIGPIIAGVGVAMDIFGKKAADVSEAGLKFLGDELKKTQKGFKDISDAGAVFGGGMTEMRNVAAGAGLDITQLATVVRSSKDDLVGMGLGLGEATKRIAGVSKELRTSELGIQLRKLGYSAEEQAGLAAGVAARMSAAGDTRIRSDAEVAKMTAQYGKDLKVLGDITGQDAKKAMETARLKAQEQDLLVEAMSKGGPEAVKKLENQLASMPESLKKGYMEFVSTGGSAIADAATNVAISQNPKIMDQYRQQYQTLGDINKDGSAALRETSKLNEDTYKYAKDNASASKEIAVAARLTGSTIARGATDIANGMILGAARQQKGATEAADKAVEGAAENMAPLDAAVAGIEENAQKLKAAMGDELTGPIGTFAETLSKGSDTVAQALEKLGVKIKEKGTGEKVGEGVGALGGAAAGAAIGSLVPVVGTLIGGLIGGAIGAYGGQALGGMAGKKFDERGGQPLTKMGNGGVVSGPTPALIGEAGLKEAVIPLPNGKSVPLDLDLSSITNAAVAAVKSTPIGAMAGAVGNMLSPSGGNTSASESVMQEQVSLLREIREVLNNSKDLQQQYVNNTYN